ncbi:MAG: TetR/AcrR family transcriptional regulator [Nocardioides sp.]
MSEEQSAGSEQDRRTRILQAVLSLLAAHGIAGVSMRAVSREAGVALGLVHYYFDDKVTLIAAALREVEQQDLLILAPDPALSPEDRVRAVLHRIADPEFLTTEYLSLRLQLWSLAQAAGEYAEINSAAQARYRQQLASLLREARPDLSRRECDKRAADIDVVQNGVWLTALLGLDQASIRRSVARTEAIALE